MSEMDCGYRNWDRGSRIPSGLKEWYENLRVQLHDGASAHVRIQRYRCANATENNHSAHVADGQQSRLWGTLRDRCPIVRGSVRRADYTGAPPGAPVFEEFELSKLLRVFLGWGDPLEIAQVLRLAVWSGVLQRAELQLFCDLYLGVDCCGFAGNFYGGIYRGTRPTTFSGIGRRVHQLDQVRQGDAIVWTHHVAVIDYVDPADAAIRPLQRVRCWVAESTGSQLGPDLSRDGGLSYTDYMLIQGRDTVTVNRPTAAHVDCEQGHYHTEAATTTVYAIP